MNIDEHYFIVNFKIYLFIINNLFAIGLLQFNRYYVMPAGSNIEY